MNAPVERHLLSTLLALELIGARLHVLGQRGIGFGLGDALRLLRGAQERLGEVGRQFGAGEVDELLRRR